MTTATLLSLLVVKTLILSVGVLAACLLFCFVPIRSPGLCRLIWGGVLLLGVFGAGLPVTIPVHETAVQPFVNAEIQPLPIPDQRTIPIHNDMAFHAEMLPLMEMPDNVPQYSGVQEADILAISTPSVVAESPRTWSEYAQSLRFYLFPALLLVWLAGIATLLARRLVHYCRLLKHLKTAVPVRGDDLLLWRAMLREHNIRPNKLALWTTSGIGPALVRTPRGTVVVVPNDLWQDASERVKSGILRHELAHDRRHDLAVCGVVRWLTVLHWFNPLAWLAVSKFEEATEWACDVAAFGRDRDGELHFAESMIALHDVTPSISLNDFAFRGGKFRGGKLTRRAELLKIIITHPKESVMKKIALTVFVLSLLLAGMVHVRFVVQAKETEETTTEVNETINSPDVTESDTEFKQRMKEESLAAVRKNFENALEEIKGDILSATRIQQFTLVRHSHGYVEWLREAGREEDARELALRLLDWCGQLIQAADQMEDDEDGDGDKVWLFVQVSSTWSLFARLGMDDAAVEMAKSSIREGQYNAAERLIDLARTIARREGFQRAIPILDEAIVAANKLSRESWREHEMINVAEVYAEVGRDHTARELISGLSERQRAIGFLRLVRVAESKDRPENELLALLKEAETAAEEADKSFEHEPGNDWDWQNETRFNVAMSMAGLGKIEEATALFEKTHAAGYAYAQDEFQRVIGTWYWSKQHDFAAAEACVDRMNSPTAKANLLSSILREAKQTESHETIRRLMEKAEPFVEEMGPMAHRLTAQMQLAAYQMMTGEEEEGRRKLDKLIDTEIEDEPSLTRNWRIDRAISRLAIAGQYEEAEKRIAMLGDDRYGREIAVSTAYRTINSIRHFEENPGEWKTVLRNQRLSEEQDR